jgi:3-methyladenine DNA glycosylase Tag
MTRMWMINPKKLCRQHLLGEHKELHQLLGSLKKQKSIKGHIEKGQVEVHKIESRHKALVKEMKARGYKHQSPLSHKTKKQLGKINILENYKELEKRCKECRKLIKNG